MISCARLEESTGGDSDGFHAAKIATTRFYADHVLSQAAGLAHCIIHGGAGALAEGVF